MTCTRTELPGGGWVITCSRGRSNRCRSCGQRASLLCDWKLRGPKAGKTCDAHLCASCARSPAPGKDLCPAHWRAYEQWLAAREGAP